MTSENNVSTILLVEDDAELGSMIVSFLSDQGFAVDWIQDGEDARDRLQLEPAPDLVILDVMLPRLNGVEICKAARPLFTNPILMLTANKDDFTEINSLNRGADGYLTKPVRPHVLLAHIQSMLRRTEQESSTGSSADTLVIQGLEISPESLIARVDGERLSLSTAEYQLLEYLAKNAGRVVTRDELYQALRGFAYDGLDRSIDMRISTLRSKMNDAQPPFRYIKTVRGSGYLLAVK